MAASGAQTARNTSTPHRDFLLRNVKWQNKRMLEIQKVKKQQDKNIEKNLPFKPDIDKAKIEKVL